MQSRGYIRLVVFFCLALLACTPIASGQGSGNATMSGRITDSSGAVIPDAKVEIKQLATNQVFPTVTTDSGDYTVANLPIGTYEIRVTKQGFQAEVESGMALEAGGNYRFDITLKVGTVQQVTTVTAEASLLKSETVELNTVIDNSKIVELPLNGRDIQSLSLFVPGVQGNREAPLANNPSYAGLFDIAGMRTDQNITTIDGGIVSDGNSGMNFIATPEWVQEFELKTALYGAEFGIRPGGQFTIVAKSGTNTPHGTLFDFLRNNDLDARNFFTQGANPPYRRNQFGVVFGGPIYLPHIFNGKDRAWFFISYSGQRLEQINSLTGLVPTAAQRQGQFTDPIIDPTTGMDFPQTNGLYTIPSNRISAQAKAFLQFWPNPNTAGSGFNFTSPNSANPTNTDNLIAKVDVRATDNDRIVGHYMWDNEPYPVTNAIQTFATVNPLHNYDGLVAYTHTFGPRVVNTATAHWYRRPYYPGAPSAAPQGFGSTLGIPGFPFLPNDFHGVPDVNVAGYLGLGDYTIRGPVVENFWNGKDQLDFSKGKHFLKFGYEWRRDAQSWDLSGRAAFNFTSIYTGDPFANFLLGDLTNSSDTQEILGGSWANNSDYMFVEDTWKVRSNLTLSLGLRYEYRGPYVDKRGLGSNFIPSGAGTFNPPLQNLTLQPWQTGRYQAGVPIQSYTKNGEEPRVGIVYALRPTTVVRAGWGIYGTELSVGLNEIFGQNPRPQNYTLNFLSNPATPNLFFSNPFNTANATAPGLSSVYGVQTPYPQENTQEYGLTIEQTLGPRTMLEVGYQGSETDHTYTDVADNDATPGPGLVQPRRPFPNYSSATVYFGKANASWNALEAKLEERPGPAGLTAILSFTYAKQIDENGARFAVPGDPGASSRNVSIYFERGNGEDDIGSKVAGTVIYQFPFGAGKQFLNSGVASKILGGWSTTAIFLAQVGPWITPVLSFDNANVGSTASQRPNISGNPNVSSSQRTRTKWFNTAVFSTPAQYTYGNAPRSSIQAPGLWNVDWSIIRNFKITETSRLEFRFETFNTFNHTQFGTPGTTFGTSSFGVIGSALDPRQLQFGLKFYF